MASHFSANQYENAFDSRRLQNWQLPKTYKERPDSYEGVTQIIATDRGHLKEGVPRSSRSPWGEFVGTWDMPRKIPGNITTYVARGNVAVGGIRTQKVAHEQYMESAKSPKISSSKIKQKTPSPPPQQEMNGNRPGNPTPPSSKSLSKTPDNSAEISPKTGPRTPSPNSAQLSPKPEPKTPPVEKAAETERAPPIVA